MLKLLAALLIAICPLGMAPALAADAQGPAFELAVMQTPIGTPLDDIISGRAQPGFTPVLTTGFPLEPADGQVTWVRIRTQLPPAPPGGWRLAVSRAPLDRLELRVHPPGEIIGKDSFYSTGRGSTPWPASFEFTLPADRVGPSTFYLQLQSRVRGGVHLRLRDAATVQAEEDAARRFFRLVYGLLLTVLVLALVRQLQDDRAGALPLAGAALGIWLACLGVNGHLYSLPEIALLSDLGATVPQALLLLGAGPLVLATRHYSGLVKSAPALVPWMRGLGWGLLAIAAYGLLATSTPPTVLQWLARVGYSVAGLACLLMLLLDARSHRWVPLLTLLATSAAVALRVLADAQKVPATLHTLYGWQLLLAITLALYLLLPWARSYFQQWQIRRRAVKPEPTAEEKIAVARSRLEASLQSGLQNAADGDLNWIAFRRLLDGLKPVLPQSSAAVVAMHYHGEDLLQVEPLTAEPRYRALLQQRATLLKNLSRLRAPQQVGVDFDGPLGPLDPVQLAIIPLPVARPGWGALLVERQADVTYSEAELALCAEFAAMAMLAGEEASSAVNAQRTADTDPATGVLRVEPFRLALARHLETARLKQLPLCLLHVLVDQVPRLRESGGETAVAAGMRPVAELLREEIDHGDVVGRATGDGFLLVAPGKRLLPAREYADRLRAAVSRLAVDPRIAPGLSVSIGVAQAGAEDRDPGALAERAGSAAQIAFKNGGNQIFS